MSTPYPYYVGVRFKTGEKYYNFGTTIGDLQLDDMVVVSTISGNEIGFVATPVYSSSTYLSELELKPVLRRADDVDIDDYNYNKKAAKEALEITQEEVNRLGLGMNLVEASYTLDGSKCTITYTADARVDFRELLKVLASDLHCRIELRQIAPRDKAKSIGGLGICGLPLCCTTFLSQFDGISINKAKNQMLSLNIPKLSGACGKLICCLNYEDDMYTEAKKEFPRFGTVVKLEEGDYQVSGMNILSRMVKLSNDLGDIKMVPLDDVLESLKNPNYWKQKKAEEEARSKARDEFVEFKFKGQENQPKQDKKNQQNQPKGPQNNQNGNQNNNNGNRHHGHHHHHRHGRGGNGNNNQSK